MAVAAQQSGLQFAMPIGPNTVRATTKWSGGNGADLFARAGEPVYAIADGYVERIHGVTSPFGEVPTFLLRTNVQGISAQYTHTVLTASGQVHRGQQIGYVSDPSLNALGAYPGMPDNFQHLDFTMGYGNGPFPVTGGQINVNSWLEQNGYGGRVFQGQSRGPGGTGGGGSTFGNLSQIFNPFGQMFGGQGGASTGANVGGNYGLLGLQNQQLGPTFDNGDGGSTAFQGGDTGVIPVSPADVLSGLTGGSTGETFQLSNRIDFQNPFEGIPEEWADMLPFLLAALIVAVGVGLIEHGEEHGGTKSPAIWLAILVILGVFLFRQAKSGGTVADAVVEAINAFAPAVQNQLSLANNTSTTAGPGTLTQPLTGNRVGMPSLVNGVQNVASRALGIALGQRGQPYVWAGASPTTGFDCSGLVQWAYAQAGVNLPRTAQTQYNATRRVSQSDARPGDLVFFGSTNNITHVGIYMGNGQMLDALDQGYKVEPRSITAVRNLAGFGRVGQ